MTVPLRLPAGRAGFGPQLQLDYQSSSANGPFGVGWRLSGLLSMAVDTTHGLPRYDATDRYAFSAAGELIAVAASDARDADDGWEDAGDYVVRRFRARFERGHHRIEQWIRKTTRGVHWITRDARGAVTIYGEASDGLSRIADPDDPHKVFQWLPELQFDPCGNAIRFDYVAENGDTVDRSSSSEAGRIHAAATLPQRYLKRVRWGNTRPINADASSPAELRWCFEAVFDYGDHSQTTPKTESDAIWPARPDAFSTCVAGFDLRTYRYCHRILVYHRFPALHAEPVLVTSYELQYDARPEGMTLTAVNETGHRREADGSTPSRSRPRLSFTYSRPTVAAAFQHPPADTAASLPLGLDGPRYRWMDLYGEGLSGILVETPDAWFYRRNEGGGRFSTPSLVVERPAYLLGRAILQDLDGDGNPDLTVVGSRGAGYYEFNRATNLWSGFRPFESVPHLDDSDLRVQWLDLDGDGRPELVLGGPDRLTWFRSIGKRGFEAGVDLQPVRADEHTPAVPFRDDGLLDYFFADMNGDGLADQVLVRNGFVAYWPNLGHGRFGSVVIMDQAPHFAPDDEFDSARLLFADLDGSGTADLLYIGRGEITCWTNAAGNRFLAGETRRGLPFIDDLSSVRVLDFLGDGTPSLVWSAATTVSGTALQHLPLTNGVKAGLLLSSDNGLGLVRRLEYGTSATHYLNDRLHGISWRTRLASHVVVVDRIETRDDIGGARSVSRYVYHDGVYDERNRRFVGFGCSEVFDTELVDDTGADPSTIPSVTRTFVHLGTDADVTLDRAWRDDAAAPILAAHVLERGIGLWTEDEAADALAAAAGRIVRQEVFAIDANGRRAAHPHRVHQTGYLLRRLQPASTARRAVVTAIEREVLTAVYEQQADDPRLQHVLQLETDAYGIARVVCTIAYPRRSSSAAEHPSQRAIVATAERTRVTHIDDGRRFQLAIGIEREEFDLAGMVALAAGLYSWTAARDYVARALAAAVPHDASDVPPGGARRTAWARTYYYDALPASAAAPLGSAAQPLRLHHVEEAAFSTTFAAAVYGDRVSTSDLETDGMYHRDSGHWWRQGETYSYGDRNVFHRLERLTRGDGGSTRFEYDEASLMPIVTIDAADNRVAVTPDYHVMAPARSVDENNHVSEIAYDALGIPVLISRYGEVLDDAGTLQPYGFEPLASVVRRPNATPESAIADPAALVQGAAQAVVYDVNRWRDRGEPPVIVQLRREMPVDDGTVAAAIPAGDTLITVTHIDAFGRALQEKTLVDAGEAVSRATDGSVIVEADGRPVLAPSDERWRTSGHLVFNPRQELSRQYEPFFSTTWRFEPDVELARFGAVHAIRYDALGRDVRRDHPDGTHDRREFGPWRTRSFDANDTVDDSTYRTRRELLPVGDPEREALNQTRMHAETPISVHFDAAGREVLRTESSGEGQTRTITTTYAPDGAVASVRDARDLEAMRWTRDMLGRVVRTDSIDTGWEVVLFDALDRPRRTWDAGGVRQTSAYDRLDRLLSVDVDGLGMNRRVHDLLYGDDPTVADGVHRNARGRVVRSRDEAGTHTVERYTPSGEIIAVTRRVTADPERSPDWRTPDGVDLLPDSFATRAVYDGLGRARQIVLPDGATLLHRYDRGGGLRSTSMSTADGLVDNVVIFDGAELNARGQRQRLRLGNDVTVTHVFDNDTWRTTRIVAMRDAAGSSPLQDLEYTYDPVGNIVRSVDRVHQPSAAGSYLTGLNVSAVRTFTYDGFYQLRQATGRVHRALMPNDHRTDVVNAGTMRGARRLSLNDGGQLERYTQTYTYDVAGNMTRVRHQGTAVNWTQDYWVSASSNRALPALDANGLAIVNPETYFDAVGNCIRLPHVRRMQWDHRRMPRRAVIVDRSALNEASDVELYLHDAGGMRVRKVTRRRVNGGAMETTDVLYFEGCEIRRTSRGATPLIERRTTHVQDGFNRVAEVHRWTLDSTGRETTDTTRARVRYQLTDHLGSSVLQLDASARVITFEEYLPYGGSALLAGDDAREVAAHDYRFSGRERDDGTGLHYFGQRYYAPWLGRWMSADPSGPVDGLNLYQYALNNPITNIDPDGLQTTTRGSKREIEQPIPPEVHAGFNKLPADQQEKVRRGVEWTWFFDIERREAHFGPIREMEALAEAMLRRGGNIGEVVDPKPKPKRKPPRQGLRAGTAKSKRHAAKPPASRQSAEEASATGAGGGGASEARGQQGTGAATSDEAANQAKGPDGESATPTGSGRSRDQKNPSAKRGDGTDAEPVGNRGVRGGGGPGDGPSGTGEGVDVGRGELPGDDDRSEDGGEEGPDQGGDGERSGTGDAPGTRGGQVGGDFAGGTGGMVGGRIGGLAEGAPKGSLRRENGTGSNASVPANTPTRTGDTHGPRGAVGDGPGGGVTRQRVNQQQTGPRGGGGPKKTVMDRVAQIAGWWRLEFSGREEGESGGVPGGSGSHNLGAWGQALYAAITLIDIVLTFATLGGLLALKSGVRAIARALTRAFSAARGRIASVWAGRAAIGQSLRAGLSRGWALFREWLMFWNDLGGRTLGLGYGPFRLWMRTRIQNRDLWAGRTIAALDTAFHEGFHAVMAKVPFWWAAAGARLAGRPIGAVLMWAEEIVAYTIGHLRVGRLHALPAVPLEALGSVYSNFGKGAAGWQGVKWAIGEAMLLAGAYFGLRDSEPQPAASAP